jgi:hypothetical protein
MWTFIIILVLCLFIPPARWLMRMAMHGALAVIALCAAALLLALVLL